MKISDYFQFLNHSVEDKVIFYALRMNKKNDMHEYVVKVNVH